jgi:hypothetical protein
MVAQGEKTVYETVPLLGKFCLLYRGLAELCEGRGAAELDPSSGFGNDYDALFGGLLNALG